MEHMYYCILLCYLFLTQSIQSRTSKTLVASNTLYTADYLDTLLPFFSKSIMEMSSMHTIDKTRPIWDIIIELNNTNGNEMNGFIGFEYQKYSPKINYRIINHQKPTINIIDVCHNSHLKNSD
eukprot:118743_1